MREPDVIDALDALERYARAFDEISQESDAHYSARSFVRWVRLEATAPKYGERRRLVPTAGTNVGGRTPARTSD